ncbi:MAG TPA: cytochrome P450 [Alcaligenes sp.]|nr:cytochrome P450 [Alcaligenes sp.]HRL27670.1 cytochrome P450 [Alcaligenes sp.]
MFKAPFIADPYAFYADLRQGPPLVWTPDFCGGAWLVHRHADVRFALRDPALRVRRIGGWTTQAQAPDTSRLYAFKSLMARALVFVDRPRHTRIRRVLSPAFTPDAMRALEPAIQTRCQQLAGELRRKLENGQADLARDICRPLPVLVMMDLLGLRDLPAERLLEWTEAMAHFLGTPTPDTPVLLRAQHALLDMADCLSDARHLVPDGLAWRLLHDQNLSLRGRQERLAQCCMLLFAGYETSRHLLGTMLNTLIQRADLRQTLEQHPQQIPAAVREFLRHDSPIQYTARRLEGDRHWHGQTLRKGQLLVLLLGAANHDPDIFPDPQTLDFTRHTQPELSLGHGIHHCLGAGLAQLEARLAVQTLLPLLPSLQSRPGQRIGLPAYRGWDNLPVQAVAA